MTLIKESSVKTKLKVLNFDLENMPLTYMGNDYTSAQITAVACGWHGEDHIDCWALGEYDYEHMIKNFMVMYNQADMVVGHYILRHDLGLINAACMELELPMMSSKLVHDTKVHMKKKKELSASQESLASMYGLPEPKHHMDQPSWRTANRLGAEGIAKTKERVIADVVQNKALYAKLNENGVLNGPKMWNP